MTGTLPVLLASAALLACAGSAATVGGHGPSGIQLAAAAAPALRLPVAPPPEALSSHHPVPPDGQIGSSYLHVRVWTYRVPLPSSSVIAYYTVNLKGLGYTTAGEGYSGDQTGITSYDESYSLGQNTVFLTVLPSVRGVTRYSVALDRVELPARPAASLVPQGVSVLQVAVRYGARRWIRRTITAAAEIAPIVKIVNTLQVYDPGGRLGCLPVERTAVLRFAVGRRTYTFRENASCLSVAAPGEIMLSDTNRYSLWDAAEKAVGMPGTAIPGGHG